MDKNNDALANAYQMILEGKDASTKKATTVGKDMSGQSFEGADKNGKPSGDILANAKEVKKPVEGPSQGDDAVAKGKGKPAKKVEENVIPTTFDKLYASVLKEEEGIEDEIAPAGDVEDPAFDEDMGDFPEGDLPTEETGEFDAASAFAELASAIQAIADKLAGNELGAEEASDEFSDEIEDEQIGDETSEVEPTDEVPFKESASVGKIPEPTTPKVAKKTTFNPKMTKNPKNNIGKSGAGKANLPPAKDRTGTLSKAPATKFGPKMSQTVGGTGPSAKGGNESFIK